MTELMGVSCRLLARRTMMGELFVRSSVLDVTANFAVDSCLLLSNDIWMTMTSSGE